MNQVDEIVYSSLRNYPALYKYRSPVLNSVLCSCGTGYDWYKRCGYAVLADPHSKVKDDAEALSRNDHWRHMMEIILMNDGEPFNCNWWDISNEQLEKQRNKIMEHVQIRDEAHLRYDRWFPEPLYYSWDVGSRYSPIRNFPDRVHPEWAKAIQEVAEKILLVPEEIFTNQSDNWWHSKDSYDSLYMAAKTALIRLEYLGKLEVVTDDERFG